MPGQIRVLIIDDQPRTRQSLKVLLAACSEVTQVQEAALAYEAMRLLQESQSDVALMDVQMRIFRVGTVCAESGAVLT